MLGIPRGGLPVAHPVAGALGVALDVIVASKIGAPNDTEFAIGAVASDGSLWRDEDLIDRTGADEAYAERAHESEAREAREKLERYRESAEPPDLTSKHVLVVDDGFATGATVTTALSKSGRRELVTLPSRCGSGRRTRLSAFTSRPTR